MKKLDNFTNCLAILADADFKMAETNYFYSCFYSSKRYTCKEAG